MFSHQSLHLHDQPSDELKANSVSYVRWQRAILRFALPHQMGRNAAWPSISYIPALVHVFVRGNHDLGAPHGRGHLPCVFREKRYQYGSALERIQDPRRCRFGGETGKAAREAAYDAGY
jgi:hypothetical protein